MCGQQWAKEVDRDGRENFWHWNDRSDRVIESHYLRYGIRYQWKEAQLCQSAEDRRIRWTTYQNLSLWFDTWEVFLIQYQYGFASVSQTGELVIEEQMKKEMDETCLSLDGSNGNRGGCPTVTYYDVCFPQLGKATSKSALTTTMISESTAAGEPLPPHFQFQTLVQSAKAEAIRIETIQYMLDIKGKFGHESDQSFLISLGLHQR
jgi:hypothetical protein